MEQYIPKSALVAEIERRIKEYQSTGDDYWFPVIENLKSILSFLDTLEMKDFWKSANGDDLPEIDREVVAIIGNGKVGFAHRPPEYWDGKNIVTGKVTRNYPKTYDKGGWNIPNVAFWLDLGIPKL